MENTAKNELLYKVARSRVGFKTHATIYALANLLIWLLWLLVYYIFEITFPWALFPTVGWGIGLTFHYLSVFKWNDKWVEKEYRKLIELEQKKTTQTN